jgi:hypothetical protein
MAEPEKSLGKKLLGFFIKEEETPSPIAAPPAPNAPAAPVVVPNAAGTAEVDLKFVEHFAALLEKANLPDYFEYKQALKSMDGLGLDEQKQFQASWASFKAMGGVSDPSLLTTSAGQYLTILEKDRAAFLKDVEKAIQERVGALQQEMKKLEEDNQTHARQILELQKKIDENRGRQEQISGEVEAQSAKINENRASFETTYQSFAEQINADISKIRQYLG